MKEFLRTIVAGILFALLIAGLGTLHAYLRGDSENLLSGFIAIFFIIIVFLCCVYGIIYMIDYGFDKIYDKIFKDKK